MKFKQVYEVLSLTDEGYQTGQRFNTMNEAQRYMKELVKDGIYVQGIEETTEVFTERRPELV